MKPLSTTCPHCRTRSVARTSREMSVTMREITFVCKNNMCGHVWVATLEDARTLSPSATPNLGVRLPLSPHIDLGKFRRSIEDMMQPPPDPAAT